MKSRYNTTRKWLIFWCLFIGIGAVAGAVGMLSKPDGSAMGMQAMLPYFQVLPFADVLFQNYVFSGISLLIVNGLTNLTAAGFMFAKKHIGTVLGTIFGVTLMMWICIQFVIFPLNFMSTIYFVFGLIQFLTGLAALIFYRQEQFAKQMKDFDSGNSESKNLVVYFSRMGYTRDIARSLAKETGADIYEVIADELTEGTKGFWWCGRYGMHRWQMPIKDVSIDLSKYDHVTICSPIWVFTLAAPMRSFCKSAAGKIKSADYVLVHYQKFKYENAVSEMDEMLQIKHTAAQSICCRQGRCIKRLQLQ